MLLFLWLQNYFPTTLGYWNSQSDAVQPCRPRVLEDGACNRKQTSRVISKLACCFGNGWRPLPHHAAVFRPQTSRKEKQIH